MATVLKKKRKIQQSLSSAPSMVALLQDNPACAATLRRLREVLLDSGQAAESFAEDLLSHGFLQLLPSILRKSSSDGIATGIEILGALSVSSFAIHCKVVSNEDAMCALTEILQSTDLDLLLSACHTVLDLVITPFGCDALRKYAVLNHLLRLLCWIADIPNEIMTRFVVEGQSARRSSESLLVSNDMDAYNGKATIKQGPTSTFQNIAFSEEFEELVANVLSAVIALLPNEVIPEDLNLNAVRALWKYWHTLLERDLIMVQSTAAKYNFKWTLTPRTRHLVARCIVLLAMEQHMLVNGNPSVQPSLFDNTNVNLELFLEKYWELSPLHMKREMSTRVFPFVESLTTFPAFVNNFLAWLVACPPAFSDPLDSDSLLEVIDSNLGEPMVYGRDIRIVRTVLSEHSKLSSLTRGPESEIEMHFCPDGIKSDGEGVCHVRPQDILQAVAKGYSVAIKGMELRCRDIAYTADCLARQFGQPSVGVNLYLTPPNAQGLGLHFDDHCVFVYQLLGRKTWNVFQAEQVLPRLYEDRTLDIDVLKTSPSTLYCLEERDVLYLPRGFPHKARAGPGPPDEGCGTFVPDSPMLASSLPDGPRLTQNPISGYICNRTPKLSNIVSRAYAEQENHVTVQSREDFRENSHAAGANSSLEDFSNYSLHLTFGLEVEPPFAWEGFVHIALRLWAHRRWQMLKSPNLTDQTTDSKYKHEQLCEAIFHVAIKIVGDKEIALRKACMIAGSIVDCGARSPETDQEQSISAPLKDNCVLDCGSGESLDCKSCDAKLVHYFQTLLELVAEKASYKDAYNFVQDTAGDCNFGMDWLRHIPLPEGQSRIPDYEPVPLVKKWMHSDDPNQNHLLGSESTFSMMKSEFGRASMFHSASNAFRTVWSKYRTSRKKIMNGMLAIHNF